LSHVCGGVLLPTEKILTEMGFGRGDFPDE
jgi:hypothetical protein